VASSLSERTGTPRSEHDESGLVPSKRYKKGLFSASCVTHIAITESLNGKNVDWMEKVSDKQYSG
jgi:hypothetical protein